VKLLKGKCLEPVTSARKSALAWFFRLGGVSRQKATCLTSKDCTVCTFLVDRSTSVLVAAKRLREGKLFGVVIARSTATVAETEGIAAVHFGSRTAVGILLRRLRADLRQRADTGVVYSHMHSGC
jgi:hypothetical protein